MTTLPDIRARVRKDLHDTDASVYRWTDSQLDRHIDRALSDLSIAIPLEKSATIATTNASRELPLASLAGLISVEAVEYRTGEYPPSYVGFSRWADSLTLHLDTPPDGSNAKVLYTARHTLDGAGSTLPVFLEDVLATGAAGYAALELEAFSTDRVTTGGSAVVDQYGAWGRAWLTAFRELLRHYGRDNRARPQRLYVPAG